jgi:SAM-dependent methyltransferase
MDPDEQSRAIAAETLADGDPTGWFDKLYLAAQNGNAVVPWDRGVPGQLLVDWAQHRPATTPDRSALVVGAGYGRDAEYIAQLGYDTIAFDISPTAIDTAQRRHPDSAVRYVVADLLDPPPDWLAAFDLVVESLTVQALPEPPRGMAIRNVGRLVKPGGTLIVVSGAQTPANRTAQGPPWLLTRAEIEAFATAGLEIIKIEEIQDATEPEIHRWRAEFRGPTS